jgi:hypothetical protein
MTEILKTNKSNEFASRFKEMSNAELINAFNREVGINAFVSSRAAYLSALHDEFEHRQWDYSLIGDKTKISLNQKIELFQNNDGSWMVRAISK